MHHDPAIGRVLGKMSSIDYRFIPLSSQSIDKCGDSALNKFDIEAIVGLMLVKIQKNAVHPKQYVINHHKLFFIIVFIISDSRFNEKKYTQLRRLFMQWVAIILKNKSQSQLANLEDNFKKQLNLIEIYTKMTNNFKKDYIEEQKNVCTLTSILFLQFVGENNAAFNTDQFKKQMKENIKAIFYNKKYHFLIKFMYEVRYLIAKQIASYLNLKERKNFICSYLKKNLLAQLSNEKLSNCIQILNTLLNQIMMSIFSFSQEELLNLKGQIINVIQKYITIEMNLNQKMDVIQFHLRESNFFKLLQSLLKGSVLHQIFVTKSKKMLRESMNKMMQTNQDLKIDSHDVAFYLRMRQPVTYLKSINKYEINQFPDVLHSAVQRACATYDFQQLISRRQPISNQILYHFVDLKEKRVKGVIQMLENFNILQKCLYLYYIFYYFDSNQLDCTEETSILKKIKTHPQLHKELVESVETIFQSLPNQTLIQICKFFIFQIQLGNQSGSTQIPSKIHLYQNTTNIFLYKFIMKHLENKIIKLLEKILDIYLNTIKIQELVSLFFFRELILNSFVREDQKNSYFICKHCYSLNQTTLCYGCQSIGFKFILSIEKQPFQRQNFHQSKKSVNEALKQGINLLKQKVKTNKNTEKISQFAITMSILHQKIQVFL